MAAALCPEAIAVATDGSREATSPAAKRPGTLVANIRSTAMASAATGPRVAGRRAELLGEGGSLVQRHGHEQSATWTIGAVGKADSGQRAAWTAHPGDVAFVDRDSRCEQPLDVVRLAAGGPVCEQRHVVAPRAQQKRAVHARGAPVEHTERPIADLPAVTERAVEHTERPHRSSIPGTWRKR